MECDEVDVIAGHKEKPETIHGPQARCSRPKSAHGRATLEKEKPPIFGMIERNGEVRIEIPVFQKYWPYLSNHLA